MNDPVIREYKNISVNELIELLNKIVDKDKKIGIIVEDNGTKCYKIKNLGWVNILGQSEGEYAIIARSGNKNED